MREIVKEAISLSKKISNLTIGFPGYPTVNPAAQNEQITRLEGLLQLQLPPSYVEFLQIHNGLKNLIGEFSYLSTEDYFNGDMYEALCAFKLEAMQNGDDLVLDGVIIGLHPDHFESVILDTRKVGQDREMECVYFHRREFDRHKNFREHLIGKNKEMYDLLMDLQGEG